MLNTILNFFNYQIVYFSYKMFQFVWLKSWIILKLCCCCCCYCCFLWLEGFRTNCCFCHHLIFCINFTIQNNLSVAFNKSRKWLHRTKEFFFSNYFSTSFHFLFCYKNSCFQSYKYVHLFNRLVTIITIIISVIFPQLKTKRRRKEKKKNIDVGGRK